MIRRGRLRSAAAVRARDARDVLHLRVHLLRAARLEPERRQRLRVPQGARPHARARAPGRGRHGGAGARLGQHRGARLRRGIRDPVRAGADPQPLRAAHLHRARAVDPPLRREGEAQRGDAACSAGKRVVLVDDSIVRGTTLIEARRPCSAHAGAREVHVRDLVAARRSGPCHYGIDTPTREELIAAPAHASTRSAQIIGADSLGYLSLEGLRARGARLKHGFCDACFSDEYPVPIEDDAGAAAALAVPPARTGRRRCAVSEAGARAALDLAATLRPRGRDDGAHRHRGHGAARISTAGSSASASTRRLLPRRGRRRTACTCATTCSPATWRWIRRPATRSRAGRPATATCTRCPTCATLRRAAWLDRSAIVLCDASTRRAGAPIEVAPRSILQRQLERLAARGLHREDGQRARVLPVPRRLPRGARRRATAGSTDAAATSRTTTCSRARSSRT